MSAHMPALEPACLLTLVLVCFAVLDFSGIPLCIRCVLGLLV